MINCNVGHPQEYAWKRIEKKKSEKEIMKLDNIQKITQRYDEFKNNRDLLRNPVCSFRAQPPSIQRGEPQKLLFFSSLEYKSWIHHKSIQNVKLSFEELIYQTEIEYKFIHK